MPSFKTIAAVLAITATTFAQSGHRAIITIATSHGGAGNNITNNTVTIDLNSSFQNRSVLGSVSTLYLTGAIGVPFDSVTCQAYQDRRQQQKGGNPFDSTTPALLSTNTVRVGSIVCTSDFVAMAPGGPVYSTSIPSTPTTTSTRRGQTSTTAATGGAGGSQDGEPTTVTSTSVVEPSGSSASRTAATGEPSETATASASPGLTSGGSSRELGGLEAFAGLAVAWMGVAFAL